MPIHNLGLAFSQLYINEKKGEFLYLSGRRNFTDAVVTRISHIHITRSINGSIDHIIKRSSSTKAIRKTRITTPRKGEVVLTC